MRPSTVSLTSSVADAQFRARDMVVSMHDQQLGELAVPGIVPKLSATPGRLRGTGPDTGAHNSAVYQLAAGAL